MKILSDKVLNSGVRRVLVEVSKDATIYALPHDCYVRLGYPMDDVVHSDIVANAVPVMWCPIEQRWVD